MLLVTLNNYHVVNSCYNYDMINNLVHDNISYFVLNGCINWLITYYISFELECDFCSLGCCVAFQFGRIELLSSFNNWLIEYIDLNLQMI